MAEFLQNVHARRACCQGRSNLFEQQSEPESGRNVNNLPRLREHALKLVSPCSQPWAGSFVANLGPSHPVLPFRRTSLASKPEAMPALPAGIPSGCLCVLSPPACLPWPRSARACSKESRSEASRACGPVAVGGSIRDGDPCGPGYGCGHLCSFSRKKIQIGLALLLNLTAGLQVIHWMPQNLRLEGPGVCCKDTTAILLPRPSSDACHLCSP